jgi:hypothetical protein
MRATQGRASEKAADADEITNAKRPNAKEYSYPKFQFGVWSFIWSFGRLAFFGFVTGRGVSGPRIIFPLLFESDWKSA